MTPEGYKILVSVLDSSFSTANSKVRPEPEQGQDVREVTISGTFGRDALIKALSQSGLMRLSPEPHLSPDAPKFAWNSSKITADSNTVNIFSLTDINAKTGELCYNMP